MIKCFTASVDAIVTSTPSNAWVTAGFFAEATSFAIFEFASTKMTILEFGIAAALQRLGALPNCAGSHSVSTGRSLVSIAL
jgi:hypothetical protein